MTGFNELTQTQQIDHLWYLLQSQDWLTDVKKSLATLEDEISSWRVAEFAVQLKNAKRFDDAVTLLQHFFDQSNVQHHYQLGLCLSYSRRQDDACLPFLKAFVMSGGADQLIAQDHVINLAQLSKFNQAQNSITYLKQVGAVPQDEILRLESMVEFLKIYPPNQIFEKLEIALQARQWLDVDQFLALIKVSLRFGEGFAFFRLDDGEGSNLPWSSSVKRSCNAVLEFNRDIFLGHWFGQNGIASALSYGWHNIQLDLALAAQQVDLVGISSPDRFHQELAMNSIRGIPSILNTFLWTLLSEDQSSGPKLLCTAQMHWELGIASDRFFDVIRMAQSVHVISSRKSFVDLIKCIVPAENVEFIEIPGERLRVAELGDISVESAISSHYPTRYEQVLDNINLSAKPGSLWLIGAGLLAKLYCMRVRENGGVALDLGSLVDLYAGKKSRTFPSQLVECVETQVASLKA